MDNHIARIAIPRRRLADLLKSVPAVVHPADQNLTVLRARALVLCDGRVGVMRGAKWLVRHKMATGAWDPLKKDE
jgi:hypothetical protein